MSLFAIIGHDVANSAAQRQITRAEHVERLQALSREQRLVIAGPTPIGHSGGHKKPQSLILSAEQRGARPVRTGQYQAMGIHVWTSRRIQNPVPASLG